MLNTFPIEWIVLCVFIIDLSFTLIAFAKIPQGHFLRNYFVTFLSITTIWLLSNFITVYNMSPFFARLSYALGAFAYASCFILVIAFSKQHKIRKALLALLYSIATIMFCASLLGFLFTVQVINNNFRITYNNWFILYLSNILLYSLIIIFRFIRSVKKFDGLLRQQAKYMLLGNIAFASFSAIFSFVLPAFGIENKTFYFLDTCSSLFFVVAASYAIIKHRLMDIDLAQRKIAGKLLYVILLLIPFGILATLLRNTPWYVVNGIIFFAGVLLFPYFHTWIIKSTEPVLLGPFKYLIELEKAMYGEQIIATRKEVASIIVTRIQELIGVKKILFVILDSESQMFYPLKERGFDRKAISMLGLTIHSPLIDVLESEGEPVSYEDVYSKRENKKYLKAAEQMKSMDVVEGFPVYKDEVIVGALFLGEKEDGKIYNSQDIRLLKEKLEEVEISLKLVFFIEKEAARNLEELEGEKRKYQQHLIDAARRMTNIKEIPALSKEVAHIMARTVNSEYTAIYLYDPTSRTYLYTYGITNGHTDIPQSVKGGHYLLKVLREREEAIVYKEVKRWAEEQKTYDMNNTEELMRLLNAEMIFPLIFDRLLGFVVIGKKRNRNKELHLDYNTNDKTIGVLITQHAAQAIQNAVYSKKSITDNLTHLYTREYLDMCLNEEVIKVINNGGTVSYIMVDIDYFKKKNDTYGHQFGDLILKLVAEYLMNESGRRPSDVVCRYGGEEIGIISPNTDLDGAKIFAERVRVGLNKALSDERIKRELTQVLPARKAAELMEKHKTFSATTVSIGIGCFKSEGEEEEFTTHDIDTIRNEIIYRADKGLYKAKHGGRNQVCAGKEFYKGEEGSEAEIHKMKVVSVIDTKLLSVLAEAINIPGLEIDNRGTLMSIEEIPDGCNVLLLDIDTIQIDIHDVVAFGKEKNIHVAAITANVEKRNELVSIGTRVFFSPVVTAEVSDWMRSIAYGDIGL